MLEINNNVSFVLIGGTIIFLILSIFIFSFFILHLKKSRKYRDEKTKLVQSFKEELLKSQLEIQEQTLQNVSQEIHDNIGQVLSLARLNISTIDLKEPFKAEEGVTNVKLLLTKAIKDLRGLSKILNTDYIGERGLVDSIRNELEFVTKPGIHAVTFNIEGNVYSIPTQKELILFRIFQEALNNILKHSGATEIKVNLCFTNGSLSVLVEDNGCGFKMPEDLETRAKSSGMGLLSMKKRASLIGASFDIYTNENGTKVSIVLSTPVETQDEV
jgi:two-component system, NarL family, sensor kinase